MNHQLEENFHTNHDAIAHNTRIKRGVVEDATPPSPNQASTLGTTSYIPLMDAQSNFAAQQKKDMGNKKSTEPQTAHFHSSVPIAPKALTKEISTPLNIVDQMKRTVVNISIWDVVASIPSQKKLLQQELEGIGVED